MQQFNWLIFISITSFFSTNAQHFVLISAPGSGKGTFSQYMIKQHDYVQICPGDLFRQEVLQETELGKLIAPIIEAGDYVDENIVCTIMKQYLQETLKQKKQFILDGFPRSHYSLQFLINFLHDNDVLDNVCFLQLHAPDTICKERMLGRYVCNTCGYVDNASMINSLMSPTCTICDTELTHRPGDKEIVIDKRLAYFHQHIEPLLQTLKQNNYTVKMIDSTTELSLLHKAYDEIIY